MKYYNNNPEFGDAGPHEAESAEALADEMMENIYIWAQEELANPDRYSPDALSDLNNIVARMREEFISGLEEV